MNELNILNAESFIQLNKIKIHPYCMKHTNKFELKKKVLLVATCDSDIFLHPLIRSLYKNVNQEEFTLCIFDNSWSAKFNEDIYFNYGFNNILFLDNTKNYSNEYPRRGIIEIDEQLINSNNYASVIHCKTIDFCLKYFKQEGVKDLIVIDSDVLLKQNPFNIIDSNYTCVGEYEQVYHRFAPYLLYFNLDKLNINYYDQNRMLGITTNDIHFYDTGGAFTEDFLKNKEKFKEIKINEYIEHFGGGSYIFVADDINGQHHVNFTKEEQPQKSYELVYKWLKDNSHLYL